jgi:putative DNA primase/helicase
MDGRPDLSRRIGDIARHLLGEPNRKRSSRYQLRFGSNGSVAVEVDGHRIGRWYDHEAEVGGGPLALVEIKGGMSREEAEAWLEQEGFAAPRRRAAAATGTGDRGRIVTTYDYREEDGTLLFPVVRYEPKDFRQRAPKPGGGWSWSTKKVRKVLYRLPELRAAPLDATVYIVEGEKDVESLAGLGFAATTAPGGAARSAHRKGSKWRLEFIPFFEKRDVVVVPDNDEPGRAHARTVAATLAGVAARVRIIELPAWPRRATSPTGSPPVERVSSSRSWCDKHRRAS